MHYLQVEEFEPRHLFNAAGFYPRPPLSGSFVVDIVVLRVTQHAPFADLEPHRGGFGWGRSGEDEVDIGSFRSFGHPDFDAKDPADPAPGPRGPEHEGRAFVRLPGSDSSASWTGPDRPDAVPNSGGMFDARVSIGGRAPPVPAPAGSNPGPSGPAAAGILAGGFDRWNLSPRPLQENPLGGGFPSTGFFTVPLTGSATPVIKRDSGFGEEGQSGPSPDESVVPATPEAAKDTVLPPRLANALAVLPPCNLSALELSLQQFLDGLETLGPRLTRHEGAVSAWPWIVAWAAAATACEISRRELRRLRWSARGGEGSALWLFGLSAQRYPPDGGNPS